MKLLGNTIIDYSYAYYLPAVEDPTISGGIPRPHESLGTVLTSVVYLTPCLIGMLVILFPSIHSSVVDALLFSGW